MPARAMPAKWGFGFGIGVGRIPVVSVGGVPEKPWPGKDVPASRKPTKFAGAGEWTPGGKRAVFLSLLSAPSSLPAMSCWTIAVPVGGTPPAIVRLVIPTAL